MTKIPKLKSIILLAFVASFLAAMPVFAVEVIINSSTKEINTGDQFEAVFFLNTQDEDINAIEGRIVFPADLLELKEIRDGNSIIIFWIERPKVQGVNYIVFSGIIPGGYTERNGLIFSMGFQAKNKIGNGTIEIHDFKVLRNDGEGTEAKVSVSDMRLSILPQVDDPEPQPSRMKDSDPPEPFELVVTKNSAMFDGKYFLVFATQDKKSGLDYYEVREGGGPFVIAESPYLLQNQNLNEEITVKAVDKNGNERITILLSQKRQVLAEYKKYLISTILIAVVFAYIIWKIVWRKYKKE